MSATEIAEILSDVKTAGINLAVTICNRLSLGQITSDSVFVDLYTLQVLFFSLFGNWETATEFEVSISASDVLDDDEELLIKELIYKTISKCVKVK